MLYFSHIEHVPFIKRFAMLNGSHNLRNCLVNLRRETINPSCVSKTIRNDSLGREDLSGFEKLSGPEKICLPVRFGMGGKISRHIFNDVLRLVGPGQDAPVGTDQDILRVGGNAQFPRNTFFVLYAGYDEERPALIRIVVLEIRLDCFVRVPDREFVPGGILVFERQDGKQDIIV